MTGKSARRFVRGCRVVALGLVVAGAALAQGSETGAIAFEPLTEASFATYSGDGRYLATVLRRAIDVFDVASYTETTHIPAPSYTTEFGVPSFSPDGRLLAAPVSEDVVKVWEVSTGTEVLSIDARLRPYRRVAFSPSGDLLAIHTGDDIELRDATTGDLVRVLSGDGGSVISVAFSPDGTILATGSEDQVVRLWDVATGRVIDQLVGHESEVSTLQFHPSGKVLASGSGDASVRIWDVAGGGVLSLDGHTEPITWVSFNTDGSVLVTSSHDDTVRLWDVATCQNVATLDVWALLGRLSEGSEPDPKRFARVFAAEFSPDDRQIAVSYCGVNRCLVGLWDLEDDI